MPERGIAADEDELLKRRGLVRDVSRSQNNPLTATSIISAGTSLHVARWSTCVTPSIAFSTVARSSIEPAYDFDT